MLKAAIVLMLLATLVSLFSGLFFWSGMKAMVPAWSAP